MRQVEKSDIIKKLKEEYENIKVNEKGIDIMKRSINEAKKQKRKFKNWMSVAVAGLAVFVIAPNVSPTIAMGMSKIPLISGIVDVITLNKYSDETKNIDVQYPLVQNGDNTLANLNITVDEYIKGLVEQFENDFSAGSYSSLDINYVVLTDTESLFSLKIIGQETAASGYEFSKVYNVNKVTGEIIELKDIFKEGTDYVAILSENIKNQMIEQMKADESKYYFIDGDIEENNFKQIKADQNFYITTRGDLVILFDEYEVAPGSMGSVEFTISKEVIKDYLK